MKGFLVRSLVVLPIPIFLDRIYDNKGLAIGAVLALASFYLSRGSFSLIIKTPFLHLPYLVVLSFLFRLTIIAVIFYLIARFSNFELVAVLESFVILYTLLLFLEMRISRTFGSG